MLSEVVPEPKCRPNNGSGAGTGIGIGAVKTGERKVVVKRRTKSEMIGLEFIVPACILFVSENWIGEQKPLEYLETRSRHSVSRKNVYEMTSGVKDQDLQ